MAEEDTWESRENLQNAGDLLKEFEEEYNRDSREVRQQEKVENCYDLPWTGLLTSGDAGCH